MDETSVIKVRQASVQPLLEAPRSEALARNCEMGTRVNYSSLGYLKSFPSRPQVGAWASLHLSS